MTSGVVQSIIIPFRLFQQAIRLLVSGVTFPFRSLAHFLLSGFRGNMASPPAVKYAALTPEQVKIVKSTVPVLEAHGETITSTFYKNMLTAHPELNLIFNKVNQLGNHQPRALAGALYAYASNLDNLGLLSAKIELIAAKHASLYIQPAQYEIVGEHLIGAMKIVLGDAMTDEITDAWAAAYWQLAGVLINREAELYSQAGKWTNWRDMRVARKERESAEITSFYFEPIDGKNLPSFLPGQFISVQLDVPALGHRQSRQYSLSDACNPKYYRISVKRERGIDSKDPRAASHPGLISNILHDDYKIGDVIQLSHPFGDFFFDAATAKPDAPLVLLGAGVGLTSLLSILNSISRSGDKRPVSWIHTARSSTVRAFGPHVNNIAKANLNVNTVIFTDRASKQDVQGVDYHLEGRMALNRLDKDKDLFIGNADAQYYICGPTQYMMDMEKGLLSMGVAKNKINVELFGTGGVHRV